MKINIDKNIIQEALQLVVNISPKNTSEPIINNVLIEAENGLFTIKATNYDHYFCGSFPCEVIQSGKTCINTLKLANLVREFRTSKVHIETTQHNWVLLTCGPSVIKLPEIEPSLFPNIEFPELNLTFQIPGSILKNAIDRTFFSIGENQSRKNLMGLNLKATLGNKIVWTGADAFKISQYVTADLDLADKKADIIIPKTSLMVIKKILDFRATEVSISFNENTFQVFSDQIRFKTRLIEVDFPNLSTLIDTTGPIQLELPKSELINAVRILYRVTEDDPNASMKLTLNEGKLMIEIQKQPHGEGNDEIICDYVGETVKIGINILFFLECIQAFENVSDEMIILNFSNALSPLLLRSPSLENFRVILMPVKLVW